MLFGKHRFRKRLRGLLDKYDIAPMFEPLGGLDASDVGANGSKMSNGMRKMIIVVRTLLDNKAAAYLFDEPTAGLDSETANKVMLMIREECRGKTVLVVTHSDLVKSKCTNVVDLGGRLRHL
jgi:ABC-type transport system involved in cytochrome bd biosynthesis fused ATPase/permease subunit